MSDQNTAENKTDEPAFGAVISEQDDYAEVGANNATVDLGGENFVASQSEFHSRQQTPSQRKRDTKSKQK